MSVPYLKFTGDFSQLKSMGFEFCKLFAGNRMQWSFENVKHMHYTRIWKAASRITLDDLTNYEGRFFEALFKRQKGDEPLEFHTLAGTNYLRFVKNIHTHEVSLCPNFIAERRKADEDFMQRASEYLDGKGPEPVRSEWEITSIEIAALATIGELRKKGWVELAYYEQK
tara:strand:- start:426 stop:932 length:507 start_codon:yes stop_codon:yes gene_type:complete